MKACHQGQMVTIAIFAMVVYAFKVISFVFQVCISKHYLHLYPFTFNFWRKLYLKNIPTIEVVWMSMFHIEDIEDDP